ncbi:MAG: hypothetical protein OEV00_09075 [Acidobacteriota bacterium]|nr:hypothetical protein [Acidobacteriota bacterium]MDH3785463.1 hypothetical protein [Acidobacteriota bacterium]
MKKRALGLIFVAAMLVWGSPVSGAPADADNIGPVPGDEVIPQPIPLPVVPQPVPTTQSDRMQLVGFSTKSFAGNVGVLTMSSACQETFAASRVCTVDEIRMSVNIPSALFLGGDSAWTQNMAKAGSLFLNEPDLNCSGWMSNDHMDYGTTINLGACFGGIKTERCHIERAVACCSMKVPVAEN